MNTKFFIIITMYLTVHGSAFNSYGQIQIQSVTATTDKSFSESALPDLESQLAPLDKIIYVALQNSPTVKGDSLAKKAGEYNVLFAKRNLHDNISLFGNAAGGSQQLGLQTTTGGSGTSNVLNGYRYGVNLTIPLSEFTLRKSKIKQAQAQVDVLSFQKEQTEMDVKRQVALEYNNLIAAQKLLKIKSGSLENFRVLFQLAEKQFREGTTQLEDYAYVSEMLVKSESEYELAKSNFRTLYTQFEYLIGVELTSLMKGR